MRKKSYICFIAFIYLIYCYASFAEDISRDAQRAFDKEAFIKYTTLNTVLRIGLVDCIAYALNNNSDIKISRMTPRIKEADIRIAEAEFEPELDAGYIVEKNNDPSDSSLFSAGLNKSNDTTVTAQISGRLATGTEYSAGFEGKRHESNSRFQGINPSYHAEPKITITQPLFRDFGIPVNRADIVIARNNMDMSREDFSGMVMAVITDTKTAYYRYILAAESYATAESSLDRAKDLLEINKARYEKGLISSVDLLETETAVADRQKDLIAAESEMKKASDELKLVTNIVDDPELWNAEIEPIDSPELMPRETDLISSLENAFEYRPDYKAALIDLKNRDVKIKVAQNGLLPTLDLTGSLGLNGLGEDYRQSLEDIRAKQKDWSLGVSFNMPWGGEERAVYDQKKLEKAQALLELKHLEHKIILDVRDKVREAEIWRRQVDVAAAAKEKERENYEAQKERYGAGQVSTHDMLDYQERLANAELDNITALSGYNIAVFELEEAEGSVLDKNDIKLSEY